MPESRNIFRMVCWLVHATETRIRRQQLLEKVLPQYTANGTIVRLELGNQFISVLGASMNRAMNGKIGITGLQATTAQTVNYYDQHAVSDFNTGIVSGNGDSRAPNTFCVLRCLKPAFAGIFQTLKQTSLFVCLNKY